MRTPYKLFLFLLLIVLARGPVHAQTPAAPQPAAIAAPAAVPDQQKAAPPAETSPLQKPQEMKPAAKAPAPAGLVSRETPTALPSTTPAAAIPAQSGKGITEPSALDRGTENFSQGNYEEALDLLTVARKDDPKSSFAAYELGATLKRMQQYTKAVPHLKDAISLQPPVKEAYLELADSYYVLGKNDDALQAIASAQKEGIDPGQTAFLKGLVLVKKKKYNDAMASFEQAKTLDEKLQTAADYQIATLYHRQGKSAEARNLFESIALKESDSALGIMARQQTDALTQRLEAKKAFSVVANVLYEYDSNVLLKPDSASAATDITNESDTSSLATLKAEYAPLLAGPFGVKVQYNFYANTHAELKDHDIVSHTVTVSPGWKIGENLLNLQIGYNDTLVHRQQYLKTTSFTPGYTFVPAEDQQAQVFARYQKKDFQETLTISDENRSSSDIGVGISWYWMILQQKGFLNLKYEYNKEDTKGANWDYQGHKLTGSGLYPLTDRLRLTLGLDAYLQSFSNTNSLFGKKRDDTTTTLTLQSLYTLYRNIDGHLMYVYTKDSSSLPIYGYSKNVVAAGLYARF